MLQQIIVRITLGRVKEGTIEPKQGKGRRERKSERRRRKRGEGTDSSDGRGTDGRDGREV